MQGQLGESSLGH